MIRINKQGSVQYLYVLLQGVDHLLGLEMAVDEYLPAMFHFWLDRNGGIAYFIGKP